MTMNPTIKVRDVAYPRLQAPDLDAMEAFLLDFGMVRAERTTDTLYMRGCGTAPYVHVVHVGEPGFRGFAFEAVSRDDLDRVAALDGFTPVRPLGAPGGGWFTSTRDPNGIAVEVVFGIERVAPLADGAPRRLNMGTSVQRVGVLQRVQSGPSRIRRFGHLALNVPDVRTTLDWYRARFGLIESDVVSLAHGLPLAVFTRCDRGAEPADHHTILFAGSLGGAGAASLNHLSWEVVDLDDIHAGNEFLQARGRHHEWGIGRHLLGSQVFDYWRDPWGHIHEHWTDGDQLDASVPAGEVTPDAALSSQWGPNPPPTFGRTIAPGAAMARS